MIRPIFSSLSFPGNVRLEIYIDWEVSDELVIYHRRHLSETFKTYPIIFTCLKDIEKHISQFCDKYEYEHMRKMYDHISYIIQEDSPCVS